MLKTVNLVLLKTQRSPFVKNP